MLPFHRSTLTAFKTSSEAGLSSLLPWLRMPSPGPEAAALLVSLPLPSYPHLYKLDLPRTRPVRLNHRIHAGALMESPLPPAVPLFCTSTSEKFLQPLYGCPPHPGTEQ